MTTCPCCGATSRDLNPRVLVEYIAVTPTERRIFDYFARHFGAWVQTADIVNSVYADDPNGGPDTAESSVNGLIARLRPKLQSVGLRIDGGSGRAGRRMVWVQS